MPVLFSNNASATLASSISTAATSITVSTGMGALFPALTAGNYFYATLTDSSNNLEIVKVTARTSDVLTVARGQDGTVARAYAAADKIELRITAAVMNNIVQLDGDQTVVGIKTFSNGIVGALTGNVTGNITGNVTGNVTGNLTGPVTGNVTGNLTGSVTGNVTGNLTGNVTGNVTGSSGSCTGNAATATNAANLVTTNFSVFQSGSSLIIQYAGSTIFTISSGGNLSVTGTVTANG